MKHLATAAGKRKTSIARAYLSQGSGVITVNNRAFENYFPIPHLKTIAQQPFEKTETVGQFDAKITVRGGGYRGQVQAVRHALAKALIAHNPDFRGVLKKARLLTRDARQKERKKYGQKGARARFQFSKR